MVVNGWHVSLITERGFDFKYRAVKNGYEEKFYTSFAAVKYCKEN